MNPELSDIDLDKTPVAKLIMIIEAAAALKVLSCLLLIKIPGLSTSAGSEFTDKQVISPDPQ
jgi:hypothetical protein